jgi:hypothetical protein
MYIHLHGNGKVPATPTIYISFSVGSSRVIFSARLVSGYTIPEFSVTSGPILPIRDLLALSWLLQSHHTTEGRFSLLLLRNATILSKIELSTQSKKNGLFLRRLKENRTKPTRIVTNLSPNVSGRVVPCRWQQQHRTCPRIGHRFDPLVTHRARSRLARLFHLQQVSDTKPRDIHRGAIIPIAIVVTCITKEPPSPLHGFCAVRWRAIRFGCLPTTGAGMAGPSGLFGVESQANQMTLVPQQTPDFPSYGRVITIISPSPTHSSSSTG